jgi:ribose 1,5-bisphosphate isomerase
MFEQTVEDIKSLKIQGAHNICIQAVEAFIEKKNDLVRAHTFVSSLLKDLHIAKDTLFETRPTEPALRNALNYIFKPEIYIELEQKALNEEFDRRANIVLQYLLTSKKRIAHVGAKKIKNGMVVYTHCHSSCVVDILLEAKQNGKRFVVVNTETRPRYQGRITATILAKAGIKVNHFVDSAIRIAIKEADIALIGADAIDYNMKIYNKIGSEMIAEIANLYHVPVYVCTDSLKYDPNTSKIHKEKLEERNPDEVWENPPKGVTIQNFAFEKINPELVAGIICELGIIKPKDFVEEIQKKYPEWFGKHK